MQAEFLTPLDVRMLPESSKQVWQLLNPLVYRSVVLNTVIIVPAGFITDFVSFEPLKNIGQRPAVIHDYLYSCSNIERVTADCVLREALQCVGISNELSETMYAAVRLFGANKTTNDYYFHVNVS